MGLGPVRTTSFPEPACRSAKATLPSNGPVCQTPPHLQWNEFSVQEKFEGLAPSRKGLMDTVKLIAYRAETALSGIVREALARQDEARSRRRDLFFWEADLSFDTQARVLTVSVHPMANPRSNRAIEHLLDELNAAELKYAATNLKLLYTLLGGASG